MKNNMDIDTNVHFIAIIFKAIRQITVFSFAAKVHDCSWTEKKELCAICVCVFRPRYSGVVSEICAAASHKDCNCHIFRFQFGQLVLASQAKYKSRSEPIISAQTLIGWDCETQFQEKSIVIALHNWRYVSVRVFTTSLHKIRCGIIWYVSIACS